MQTISKVQTIVNRYIKSGCKDNNSAIEEIAFILKHDLDYPRQELDEKETQALIRINQKYTNRFIPIVAELDFNSFYPGVAMKLNGCISNVIIDILQTLQNYRDHCQKELNTIHEKATKQIQNAYIGKLASLKEHSQLVSDPYAHFQIMKKARQTILELIKTIKSNLFDSFFIQTDAIFFPVNSVEDAYKMNDLAQSIFPTKIKIHTKFYHFEQTHKYLCETDNKVLIKGFAKDNGSKFPQYVEQFLNTQDPIHLYNASQDPDVYENKNLISKLIIAIKSFDSLKNLMTKQILVRVETKGYKKNNKLEFRLINKSKMQKSIKDIKDEKNNQVAIHEIIQDDNINFIMDIDFKLDDFVESYCLDKQIPFSKYYDDQVEQVIKSARNHPLIKSLSDKFIKCYISKYHHISKSSYHILFKIVLPIDIQKLIAQDLQENVCEAIDIQIYSIGKSLRIPTTCSMKQHLSDDEKQQQTLQIQDDELDYHFMNNIEQSINIQQQFLKDYLCQRNTSIQFESQTLSKCNSVEFAQDIINFLQEKQIKVIEIKPTRHQNIGRIIIELTNANCLVCQRMHDNPLNRKQLRFMKFKGQVIISCFQNKNKELQHVININKAIKSPEQNHIIQNILIDKPLQNAEIINRRYILENETDDFEIAQQQMVFIKSDLGTGKSSIITNLYKKFSRVLLISTRKIYTYGNQQRLDIPDEELYNHCGRINGSCLVQVESMHKICDYTEFDCIILDEFMSILQQLKKDDFNLQKKYSDQFIRVCQQSKRMFICDANLEQSAVGYMISNFTDYKYRIIENQFQSFKNNQINLWETYKKELSLEHIEYSITSRFRDGKKTWVINGSKTSGLELAQSIKKSYPEIKIKIFNGDKTSTDVDKIHDPDNQLMQQNNNVEFFKSDDKFKEFDCIITTSTITCGLNVTDIGFDHICAIIPRKTFSPQQLIQALHRCRSVVTVDLFCDSLQINKFPSSFYTNNIYGISLHSSVDINNSTTQLMALCNQYVYDLNYLGINYVKFWLNKMGYQIKLQDAQDYKDEQYLKQRKRENLEESLSSDSTHSIDTSNNALQTIICGLPDDYETDNEEILKAINQFKDCKKYQYQTLKKKISIAEYHVKAIKDSYGYNLVHKKETKFTENPQETIRCIEQYIITQSPDLFILNHLQSIILFAIQYQNLTNISPKFRDEYLQGITKSKYLKQKLNSYSSMLFDPTVSKKDKYKIYREHFGVQYKYESTTDDCINLIQQLDLTHKTLEQVQELFNSNTDLIKSKKKDFIANCLGYHLVGQKTNVKINGVRTTTTKSLLYGSDYKSHLE